MNKSKQLAEKLVDLMDRVKRPTVPAPSLSLTDAQALAVARQQLARAQVLVHKLSKFVRWAESVLPPEGQT